MAAYKEALEENYARSKKSRRHVPKWREFDDWVRDSQPTVGEAYTKLHQLWPEGFDAQSEFLEHCTGAEAWLIVAFVLTALLSGQIDL